MPAKNPRVLYQHQLQKGPRARRKPRAVGKGELTIPEILAWADEFHERTGQWPKCKSGSVSRIVDGTWAAVDAALSYGHRGLPKGSSLAQLLAEKRGAPNRRYPPNLSVQQILLWADNHHLRTGQWPRKTSGPIPKTPWTTWDTVDTALRLGSRGLPGGSSLLGLLAMHRNVRNRFALPPLSPEVILDWMDNHHNRTGQWPTSNSGPILDAPGETWKAISMALWFGRRGFRKGSTLPRLLATHRDVRNRLELPPLSSKLILLWADNHHNRTGKWPSHDSGPIADDPRETWSVVESALREGSRGLPGNSSLAQFLSKNRCVRNQAELPPFRVNQILLWSDAHHKRTGKWPRLDSGPIVDAPGESWGGVQAALQHGIRGLPGGSSLARIFSEHRGVRNAQALPRLSAKLILGWADNHHKRTGEWPAAKSGPVADSPGESWSALETSLREGRRGLPGGSSLAQLLAACGRKRNPKGSQRLSVSLILAWSDAHHKRMGDWPTRKTGPVVGAPGETWSGVDVALRGGLRGLSGNSSLPRLLATHRGTRNTSNLPLLSMNQILTWADAHHAQTAKWPTEKSGAILNVPSESWGTVESALRAGIRGLPGGSSLARLLAERRGKRNRSALPRLSVEQILAWADNHVKRTGKWPTPHTGPVTDVPGENWAAVRNSLHRGLRGLPGGSTLARLRKEHRPMLAAKS